ncbi:MAG: NAD(P)H-dependent oxidoreductase subunit E [Dehalococcoidia bacterium]|nr:MAG: NAD(P)H-dependent oxidoreductase subunit E [Dehalococcoidia bacterium]
MNLDATRIGELLADYAPEKGNLMEMLGKIQKESGNHLSDDTLTEVAVITGIPLNKLCGYVSFYSMLSNKPRGRHIIRICKDGPCAFNGGWTIADLLEKELDIEEGQTTDDGRFTLEETACLGTCTAAPALMIDDETYAAVTPEKLGEILKKYM